MSAPVSAEVSHLTPAPAAGFVRIMARPFPTAGEWSGCDFPAGLTLAEMLGDAAPDWRALIDGVEIPREDWPLTMPHAGALVVVVRAPGAPLIVPLIAPTIAATLGVTAGTATLIGGFLVSLATMAVSFAINALIGPQTPTLNKQGAASTRYSALTGASNRATPFAPLPRLYGKCRFHPPLAAQTYTENNGPDQYMYMLLCLSYGNISVDGHIVGPGTYAKLWCDADGKIYYGAKDPLNEITGFDPSAIRIGETALGNFEGVQWEIGDIDQIALYPRDVTQTALAVTLNSINDPITNPPPVQTTAANTEKFAVDLTFPALFATTNKGNIVTTGVWIKVEYRLTGSTGAWTLVANALHENATMNADRWTIASDALTPAQYDVRVTRTSAGAESDGPKQHRSCTWTALRSYKPNNKANEPYTHRDSTVMALKIKASDQLNGTLDTVNILAESVLPAWNGAAWDAPAATNNPAWAYADALRGPTLADPIADASIDLAELKAWATECATRAVTYNWYHQDDETLLDRLRAIASCGRAAWALRDGLFSVVREVSSTAIMHITPRNAWGFAMEKSYLERPHALRVRYIDGDKTGGVIGTWEPTELLVYADGYADITGASAWAAIEYPTGTVVTYGGQYWRFMAAAPPSLPPPPPSAPDWQVVVAAKKFQILETQGVTDKAQAYKEGRYHLAVMALRPETWSVSVDVENLVATRGDVVKLAYDVIRVGLISGRVKACDGSTLTLDETMTMVAGKTYAVLIRRNDNTQVVQALVTVAGMSNTVTFSATVTGVNPGDLATFGESGIETVDAKITQIEYDKDFSARLKLVPAAPAVLNADSEEIPAYSPAINGISHSTPPPTPAITSVKSEVYQLEVTLDGTITAGVWVSWSLAPSQVPVDYVDLKIVPTVAGSFAEQIVRVPAYPGSGTIHGLPCGVSGNVYARSHSAWGPVSVWVAYANNPITTVAEASIPDAVVVATLSAYSHTFSAASDGTVSDYTGGFTDIAIFVAGVNDTANWTHALTPSTGVTATLSTNRVTVTAFAAAQDAGYVDISSTKTGFPTQALRFVLAKSKSVPAAGITALTGDVTATGPGSATATIVSAAVTLAKMADMATASLLGRNTAGPGSPEVLSVSTAKTLLALNNVENTALSTWAGTSNLTTLGIVTTGTWNASVIPGQYGGTGVANTGKTITIGGNVTMSGAYTFTGTLTANTNVIFPTSGTLATLTDFRERLTAARTYYVRTDGNDSNTGLTNTSGGAFLTIQKAVDTVCALDLSTYNVTVQVGNGTYTGAVSLKRYISGGGVATIQGDTATPSNVLISVGGIAFSTAAYANWDICGVKITTSGSGNYGIQAAGQHSLVRFYSVDFGACGGSHIELDNGAVVACIGNYTISGNSNAHIECYAGIFQCTFKTISLSGTPAWTVAYAYCPAGGRIIINGNTFSGSATGKRYQGEALGLIWTNGGGASYLPGNSAGTTATGAQYV